MTYIAEGTALPIPFIIFISVWVCVCVLKNQFEMDAQLITKTIIPHYHINMSWNKNYCYIQGPERDNCPGIRLGNSVCCSFVATGTQMDVRNLSSFTANQPERHQ